MSVSEKRYPLEPLMEAGGFKSMSALRVVFPMGGPEYRRVKAGLSFDQADRWACRIGYLPWAIWPDWLDDLIEAEQVECPGCEVRFVPARKGHTFCTRNCRIATRKRERYRSDPEFAEKLKARSRADYEECRSYVQARNRRWRDQNRERISESRRAYYQRNREQELAWMRAYRQAKKAAA